MALLIAGIDEAGYGPRLGPLCVGMTLLRVREWGEGEPAPRVAAALEGAGVEGLGMRGITVGEAAVNRAIEEQGSKAEATASAVGEHMRRVWARGLGEGEHLRIVCDQLGGRTMYEGMIAR